MSNKHPLPPDKMIIYVTPEELDQLPSNAPVYVLSDKRVPESIPSASYPSKYDESVSQTSFSAAPSISVSNSNSNGYSVVPSSNPLPPPIISPINQLLPAPPGCVAYVQPPSFGLSHTAITNTSFSPWFLPQPSFPIMSNPPSNMFTSPNLFLYPQTSFHPYQAIPPPCPTINIPFNPAEPPPTLVPSLPHSNSAHNKSSLSNRLIISREKFQNSGNFCTLESRNKKSDGVSSAKLSCSVRYSKMLLAKDPDYFCFDEVSGCYRASPKLVEMEDRFSTYVIARRKIATASDPERKPPDRPLVSDIERNRRGSHIRTDFETDQNILEEQENNNLDFLALNEFDDDSDFFDLLSGSTSKRMKVQDNEYDSDSMMQTRSPEKLSKQNQDNQFVSKTVKNSSLLDSTDQPKAGDSQATLKTVGGHSIGQRSIRQQREVAYKLSHPNRLHPDIWHNEANEFNDGPACSCKPKYRIGPLHNQYEGEEAIPLCDPESNNRNRLHHYRVFITPSTNFTLPKPTKISYQGHDYIFDGFSIFVHYKLDNPPPCQILRFNLLYDIITVEEEFPEFFTIRSLDLLTDYIFVEILELLDLSWKPAGIQESCNVVHLMPRFVRVISTLPSQTESSSSSSQPKDNISASSTEVIGEMLPISVVLRYLLEEALKPVIDVINLSSIQRFTNNEWSSYISDLRGSLATFPGKKPAAIRIDQLDRRSVAGQPAESILIYPLIVHMTYTPMKLSLTREPKYKCVLKNFMKLQYLMMNKPRISAADRAQLAQLANELEEMEHSGVHRREITVEISCEGFYRTGIRPDVSQHALNLVSLVAHLRFHKSLETLEARLGYTFKDKSLLHQALTHPSYRRTNFGTNQDHFQNSIVSCGPRILEYGDKLQLYKAWRKKGLTKMIQVMSFLPKMYEERSNIYGNERLEFLGDAVIEVISSIHLFFMFPELSEGHLDAYRQAIVQNQHLAELAVRLGIHKFLLYTHSVDFCYDSTFIYARSDAFEALMAAITLDAGLDVVDRIFGAVLFGDDERIHRVWVRIPPHPLQVQCPGGDRSWTTKVPMLKKLTSLEDDLGIQFKHLRVLARAMTIRKTGFNFYTLGDNQRLEFLGDSLLKYVSTDYLFRHFPRHHEGHLSLLKNSLVNKYTQAAVCTELGLDQYVIRREDNSVVRNTDQADPPSPNQPKPSFKSSSKSSSSRKNAAGTSNSAQNQNVKYRADLLEAFIGALFVDKDLTWVERFCQVCFWPRLVEFILKQEWNDAKSKLQQCCLTFRSLHEDPEIAHYKVLDHSGPTNQRIYRVGVYFRGQRLATGQGRSVQQAQMEAAKRALELHQDTFRQLDFQRSVISKRYKQPCINQILDQVQNWDERLVDYFIADGVSSSTPEVDVRLDQDLTEWATKSDKSKSTSPLEYTKSSESNNEVKESSCTIPTTPIMKSDDTAEMTESPKLTSTHKMSNVSDDESEEGEIRDDDDEEDDMDTELSDNSATSYGGSKSTYEFHSNRIKSSSRPPLSGTLADLLHSRKK